MLFPVTMVVICSRNEYAFDPILCSTLFSQVLPYGLSVQLVFVVTIALFPATVSLIHSVDNPDESFDSELSWIGNLFSPLVCFLLFNASDYVGRTLTLWFTFVSWACQMCVCVCMCTCMCVRACVHACVRSNVLRDGRVVEKGEWVRGCYILGLLLGLEFGERGGIETVCVFLYLRILSMPFPKIDPEGSFCRNTLPNFSPS